MAIGQTTDSTTKIITELEKDYQLTDKCELSINVNTVPLKGGGFAVEMMPYISDYVFNKLRLSLKQMAQKNVEKLTDELLNTYRCYQSQKTTKYIMASAIFFEKDFSDSSSIIGKKGHVITIGAPVNLLKAFDDSDITDTEFVKKAIVLLDEKRISLNEK